MKKLLIITSLVLFSSCTSKKKVSQTTKQEIKVDSVASSIKTIDLNKLIKEYKFVPVVSERPMIINRDTFYNTQFIYRDKVVDSVVVEKDTVYLTKEIKKKEKTREKEKKELPVWFWIGLFFLVIVLMAYLRINPRLLR